MDFWHHGVAPRGRKRTAEHVKASHCTVSLGSHCCNPRGTCLWFPSDFLATYLRLLWFTNAVYDTQIAPGMGVKGHRTRGKNSRTDGDLSPGGLEGSSCASIADRDIALLPCNKKCLNTEFHGKITRLGILWKIVDLRTYITSVYDFCLYMVNFYQCSKCLCIPNHLKGDWILLDH